MRLSLAFSQSDIEVLSSHVRSYLGPLKTKSLDIGDNSYRYLEGGQGPTVIFLHGMGTSKSQSRSLLQGLTQEYHVIAPDIPGFSWGLTLPSQQRHTLRSLSKWLNLFLDQADIRQCHIVAHSSGSALAAYFAGYFPEKVNSMFLMALPDLKFDDDPNSTNMWDRFIEFEIKSDSDMNTLISSFFHRTVSLPAMTSKMYINNFKRYRESYRAVLTDLSQSAPLLYSRLSLVQCPVHFARGEHDTYCSAANLDYLSRALQNSTSTTVKETSHFFFLETPKATVKMVIEFLSERGVARDSLVEATGR